MSSRTVVLLGGSGLGPWAWERLTPLLQQAGFRTLTPQLRATGSDTTPPSQISLADWVEDLERCLAKAGGEDVTLVAHSFAGYVASELLARGTGQVRTAVFLDAVLPQAGRSWFDVMGPHTAQYMRSLANDGAVPWYTPEQLDQLYPSHGLTSPDLAWMLARVTPQPVATYDQPAMTDPLQPTSARLVYIRCTWTTPPSATVSASTPGWTYRELDSGHWPMVTDPVATARAIDAATQL